MAQQLSEFWFLLQRGRKASFCTQILEGFEAQEQDPRGEAHPAQGR